MRKIIAISLVMSLLVTMSSNAGAQQFETRFRDISNSPYQLAIESMERVGWFDDVVKPEWKNFKPNNEMSKNQIYKVLKRAFPEGITRGELASLISHGHFKTIAISLGSYHNPWPADLYPAVSEDGFDHPDSQTPVSYTHLTLPTTPYV